VNCHAAALNNRVNMLHEFKRFDQALASYDRALALQPNYAEAFYNRGVTLQELTRISSADLPLGRECEGLVLAASWCGD
jgi:tetratricopeptide (TPR) repeat protein